MANVHDVAAFIRARAGGVDRLKLQKLTYYAQAWNLVWEGRQLFPERIEAWRHGPVVAVLWHSARLDFLVDAHGSGGDPTKLTPQQMDNVDAVIDYYNSFTGWQLRELTHSEAPWRMARGGLPDDAASRAEISPQSMQAYYARREAEGAPSPVRIAAVEDLPDEDFEMLLKEELRQRPAESQWENRID